MSGCLLPFLFCDRLHASETLKLGVVSSGAMTLPEKLKLDTHSCHHPLLTVSEHLLLNSDSFQHHREKSHVVQDVWVSFVGSDSVAINCCDSRVHKTRKQPATQLWIGQARALQRKDRWSMVKSPCSLPRKPQESGVQVVARSRKMTKMQKMRSNSTLMQTHS